MKLAFGPFGLLVRPRVILANGGLVLFGFAVMVLSLCLGTYSNLSANQVLGALFGYGPDDTTLLVRELRLPRALTAVLVGVAFGLAGAVFQAVTRNPLASPDLIGISAGAGTGAITAILFGGVTAAGAGSYGGVPFGALCGALATAAAIYFFAYRGGTITGYRFVLVGLAVQGALVALNRWMLAKADIDQASRAMVWLTGSLNGRDYTHVKWVGLGLLLLVPPVLLLGRAYQLMQFDEDTARGLGFRIGRSRMVLLILATCLAAVACASAGLIGFVALGAPQVARRLTGRAEVPLVASALTGAVLILAADLLGRTLFSPTELPVGIVTGAVGAPYLMWLLARTNRVGKGG
ncbi:FecCD family ABC transporter permease [Yinghuangia soli]|uniref:Iron chelate uptake ABC transporter family permease subunit n=1 Tax=Yinghuangia soli TaxID=2908204 RepID=A0AA41Q3K8_9ACTN|nr:iron chelate uptake ABC transporter family permease subunit [Yinghuangia soli]MCF2530905.1 iron chelate uptake ABC transporter family permease subunit [Yinghuangia soli]